jgi:glycosyltransferase involved in cell wall biosynthesis
MAKPFHVLHYISSLSVNAGGTTRAVMDMCTAQARAGARVTAAAFDVGDVAAKWSSNPDNNPRAISLSQSGMRALWSGSFRTTLTEHLSTVDCVHLHGMWDPYQITVASVAKDLRKPYVVSPHGMLADWSMAQRRVKKMIFLSVYGHRFLNNASAICLTAQGELDQSKKHHPDTKGVIIPLVFDVSPFRQLPGPQRAIEKFELPACAIRLLYFSRLQYKKRPDLAIATLARLVELGHDAQLVMAGPGDDVYVKGLRQFAVNSGVESRVKFTGMVDQEKVSLLQACDALILPTSQENFGFVYFESLASGTAVVTTKGTDTWRELQAAGAKIVETIPNPMSDYRVGGGDVEPLVRAVLELTLNKQALASTGQRGRQWVLNQFDPQKTAEQYLALYRSCRDDSAAT